VKLWTLLTPRRARAPRNKPLFPLIVLIVGFGFSAAINVLATLPDPHLVMGGVMASLALPAAIHLWPMVPLHLGVATWQQQLFRVGRAVVMTGIAGMAGYITFRHGAHIMIPVGTTNPFDLATGYLYTLITESLVVLGVMAHRAPAATTVGASGAESNDEAATVGAETEPLVAPVRPPVHPNLPDYAAAMLVGPPEQPRSIAAAGSVRESVRTAYFEMARAVLAQGGDLDKIVLADVDRKAGASVGYAKKHVKGWRAELEREVS
jgi:hypothetical protein